MKKEFTPGMYCKFPNEEIPHILDILCANGHRMDFNHANDYNDCILVNPTGMLVPFNSNLMTDVFIPYSELSLHDFMVKALRLEEGIGMLHSSATKSKMEHIYQELHNLGVYSVQPILINASYRNIVFTEKDQGGCFRITSAIDELVTINIPYLEWCKRLCIEPIGIEPTAEPVFDPSKPFEVSNGHGWGQATISGKTGAFTHYVGKSKGGLHVIQTTAGFFEYLDIRNTEEFTAAMLEVGEWMEVTQVGPYEDWIVQKMKNTYLYCPEYATVIVDGNLKGRGVNVEIKAVQTKTTKP